MSVVKSCENWFNLPAGCYCGVYVKERTAKKLQKLLWRQTQEIKELLTANKEDCVPAHWTLAYPLPDKKQTTVYYTDSEQALEDRIRLFDKADRLRHIDNGVFVSDKKYLEASEEIKDFYEKMYGEDSDGEEKQA